MILATHGIIGSGSAFDLDALLFFNRVTTAGGSLSATEKVAVNQLVLDLKTNSLWTPMKAIYPMVGASAAACAQNLKSSSFTGTFSSGWTFSSTGATPNGTSAFMDTGISPLSIGLDSAHCCYYSRTNNTRTSWDIGLSPTFYINIKWTDNNAYWQNNGSQSSANFAALSSQGLFLISRTSSNVENLFRNATKFVGNKISTSTSALPIYIGAANNGTSAFAYSNRQTAFNSIGDGLTDTQAGNFYTAVQTFQTTLGRQV